MTTPPSSSVWLHRLGSAAGVFFGLVLLAAAVLKMLDPEAFAEQIVAEGIAPVGLGFAAALVALTIEFGLGWALTLGVRRTWVLWAAVALTAFFLFLNGRTWWRDSQGLLEDHAACGCFGNLVDRTPGEAFWQDLLLLVPALALAFVGRRRGAPVRGRLAAAAALTIAGVAFAAVAPGLPLDDLATRLRPGVPVDELCAGAGAERICLDALAGELESGLHLVVIAELDDERLLEVVPRLNDLALAETGPTPWVLTASPPEAVGTFRWTQAPIFELREAPRTLLRPLYRRLPRSFEVEDGAVQRTWPGLPPL